MKSNLIFIGMPAVGKSTVGIVVAKRLGKGFIDSDLLIQEQEGKLLREIIAEVGDDGFLKIENQVNCFFSSCVSISVYFIVIVL